MENQRMRSFTLDKNKCALLVIDMQKYFIDAVSDACVPSARNLVHKITNLIDAFTTHKRLIIFTRHIDSEGSLMRRWWQDNIREDDPMSQIIKKFDTKNGIVIVKDQYDAFLNTNLEDILRKNDIQQVIISGVLTNLCCETTARSAFMKGFEVYFVTDGTATYKKEMHEATLLNLAYGFAILVTVDEVIKVLRY
jgi:bifunctional isochorismate lyase/aryl carrier protein